MLLAVVLVGGGGGEVVQEAGRGGTGGGGRDGGEHSWLIREADFKPLPELSVVMSQLRICLENKLKLV